MQFDLPEGGLGISTRSTGRTRLTRDLVATLPIIDMSHEFSRLLLLLLRLLLLLLLEGLATLHALRLLALTLKSVVVLLVRHCSKVYCG